MTSRQEAVIVNLTRKLSLGHRASDGIKAVYGKVPIGMDDRKADRVIAELKEKWESSDARRAALALEGERIWEGHAGADF